MSDTDLQLLERYTRDHAEDAFAEIVRRHVALVYSAALRQVRSPQLAEEVAQSAFTDLARHVRSLAPDTVLAAWLYQVARRTSIDVVRRESRRQLRERIATEMNALNAAATDWPHLEPLLDEAVSALEETDRAAVLLRYFENKALRDVGRQLGLSEDAAQKRVSRAVERLREFFAKRGVTVGASGLILLISGNAVQAVPAGLAAAITAAAFSATTLTSTAAIAATKAIAMTTLQKTIIGAVLAAALGAGVYQAHQVSQLRDQVQGLRQQRASLAGQIEQLQGEREDATSQLASLTAEMAGLRSDKAELSRLRTEVARLKAAAATQAGPGTVAPEIEALLARARKAKQKLEETPAAQIPELKFLTDGDWVEATRGNLETADDYRKVFSRLRDIAEQRFLETMQAALQKYLQANGGQFPAEVSLLKPYFDTPPSDDILQRYTVVRGEMLPFAQEGSDGIITQKAIIDEENDAQFTLGRNGLGGTTYPFAQAYTVLAPAIEALKAASPTNNEGGVAFDISQLLPYLTTPEQKAAYYRLTHHKNPGSK